MPNILKILLLSATLAAPNIACAKFKVVTTFTIIADIAQNIAGDAATVVSITKHGAEIHDYQPTPKDIIKAQHADLILFNGLNLERWFEKFFTNMQAIPAVIVTKNIKPLSIYAGPYAGKPNPHAWMSSSNALIYVENIRQALVKYDNKNKDTYNLNAKKYSAKIKVLDTKLRAEFSKIAPKNRWLATSEGAFSYLCRDYGFKEAFLWPINAEQQGSPKQIKELIDTIKANRIKVVFSESTISDRAAKAVAHATGINYGGVLYVDSLSAKTGKVPTYLDLLQITSNTIIKGYADAKQ